jgi:type I restriction enzyme S subunit
MDTNGKYPVYGGNGITGYHSSYLFENRKIVIGRVGAYCGAVHHTLPYSWITDNALYVAKKDSRLLDEYLVYILRSANLNQYASQSGQPLISEGRLENVKIPLPPLPEQKRIAAILEKCDRLRRTRRYSLQLSETFLQSVFLEMFGNLETNSKDWNLIPFDDICTIDAEMVDPKLPEFCNLLHIGAANIESITGNILNLQTAGQEKLISSKFLINPEHILFSKIRPKLRKVAFPQIHGLCSADVYPIRIKSFSCNQYFLLHFFRSNYFSNLVSELAESRTNIPKINREELSEQSIPLPPLPLQEKFAQIVQKHERFRTQQREAERQAEHLFQTLLHRAFRGELTSSDCNDVDISVLSAENHPQQPKPKSTDKGENLPIPATQPQTNPLQLTLPGLE